MDDDRAKIDELRRILGMDGAEKGPTFGELWARYYREDARYLDSARDIARRGVLLLESWGERRALSLTTADVETYRDLRARSTTRRGGPPAPGTVNRETDAAHRCLQWAVERRILNYNPLSSMASLPENNIRQSRLRSDEELERLLSRADLYMRAIILAQIDCGCRSGEVFKVEWAHVVLVPFGPIVRPMFELWDTKNGDRRRAALSRRTYEAVDALPRFGRFVFAGRAPGRWRNGAPTVDPSRHMDHSWTLKKFQRLAAEAGLGHLWFHDLRHSFAYLMRTKYKMSEFAVRLQGGWKTRSAFERYGIGGEEELAEMYDRVDEIIAKDDPKKR